MMLTFLGFRPLRLVMLCTFALLLQACADGMGMDDGPLTPQQQALRSGLGRYDSPDYRPQVRTGETIAEGAVILGVLGALAGAAVSNNRAQGALIGGGLGAAGGAAAGAAVASNAQTQANQEAALRAVINRANSDAQSFRGFAAAAQAVSAEARQKIGMLNSRYRAGQITEAQFRSETQVYQRDLNAMRTLINDGNRVKGAMDAGPAQLRPAGGAVSSATNEMNQAAIDLARSLALVPSGAGAPAGRAPSI